MEVIIVVAIVVGAVLWGFLKGRAEKPAPPQRAQPEPESSGLTVTITTTGYEPRSRGDASNDDRDEWEGAFWEVTAPVPVNATLRIGYVDGAGRRTDRTIEVRQFGQFGDGVLIIAKCLMRDATRTFRADRIKSCVDVETGEIINDVAAFLQARYDASSDKTAADLRDKEFDTLRVLLYVGKADGQFRAEEKAVIRDTCVGITNDSRLTVKMIDGLLSDMSVPTLQAFKLATGRLAKRDPDTRARVMAAAEMIVATQKVIHPSEQEALDYMKKRFAQ